MVWNTELSVLIQDMTWVFCASRPRPPQYAQFHNLPDLEILLWSGPVQTKRGREFWQWFPILKTFDNRPSLFWDVPWHRLAACYHCLRMERYIIIWWMFPLIFWHLSLFLHFCTPCPCGNVMPQQRNQHLFSKNQSLPTFSLI
jgi:hypothetical protein